MNPWRSLLCVALVALIAPPAFPQVNTADIVGRVLDPKGLTVPGAKVTVMDTDTGLTREAATGDTGDFVVTLLPPGTYKVTVEKEGFATVVYEKVELAVGAKQTLEVSLKIGSARDTVTVTEEPPLVELTRSEIGGSVSALEVRELPLVDRNFAGLTTLVPGVRPAQGFDPTKSRVGNMSLNGGDGRQFDISVDGADDKDNVVGGLVQNFTVEGIREFNVVTNRYTAESGHTVGGIVNVVTKSGTNALHGSTFGLFQSSSFNKIDFFTQQGKQPKPVFHRYHFGGSLGGPLFKDKLFIFGAYEHKREPGSISVLPDAFNQLSVFPVAAPVATLPVPYKDHLLTVKMDYRINDKQNMSFRYGRQRWENPNDQLGNPFTADLSQANTDINQFHDFNIQHNYAISATKMNSITVHFQDFFNGILAAPGRTFTLNVAGGGTATNPNIIFPGGAQIGQNTNVPQTTFIRKYQFRDDFSWAHNHHNMKFGFNEIYLAKFGGTFFFGADGYQITFWDDPSVITANPSTCGVGGRQSCYPQGFATPGAVREIDFSGGNGTFNQRPHLLALYYQDDYRATSRLTLNLGMRWDGNIDFLPSQLGTSLSDTNRAIGVLRRLLAANPSAAAAKDGLARARLLAGNAGDLRRTTASWKEFQPRIGFAWDPTGSGKHVIRGGYGIAYDQVFQNLTLFSQQQSHPDIYQTLFTLQSTKGPRDLGGPAGTLSTFRFQTDPLPAPSPIGDDLGVGGLGFIIDPRMKDPYAQQWSIGWAWQLRPDWAFSVDYYHILGINEPRVLQMNPKIRTLCDATLSGANPGDPRCVNGVDTRVLDAAFRAGAAIDPGLVGAGRLGEIRDVATNNRSRFDTVNFVLRKRFSRNYMMQAGYVVSRSFSWGGRPPSSYSGTALNIAPENQFKPEEFGPAPFDERHRVVISGIYKLPYGFEVAPVFQVASARPFDFKTGNVDLDGDGRVTLDRVCAGSTVTAAVITPGCREIQVNPLRGDPFVQLDARFGWAYKFRERTSLHLFWEFYNLFNRQNFGNNFGEKVSSASTFNQPVGYFGGPGAASDAAARGFGPGVTGPLRSQLGFRFEF